MLYFIFLVHLQTFVIFLLATKLNSLVSSGNWSSMFIVVSVSFLQIPWFSFSFTYFRSTWFQNMLYCFFLRQAIILNNRAYRLHFLDMLTFLPWIFHSSVSKLFFYSFNSFLVCVLKLLAVNYILVIRLLKSYHAQI